MNAEQLAHLLELLHANTFTEDNFNPMLDELRRVTNSGIALLVENPENQSLNLSLSDGNNGTSQLMDEYAHALAQDPYYHYVNQFPHGQLVTLSSEVYKQIQSHPVGEYYKYVDSRYICGALIKTQNSNIAFAVNRGRHQGDYDIEEIGLLKQLIPHIKVVTENRNQLSFLKNRMANIIQALELSGQAVGIISQTGALIHCSAPFYDALLEHNLLAPGMGRFRFRSHRHHDWLEHTIKKVSLYQNHQHQTLRLSTEPLIDIELTMLQSLDKEPLFLLNLKTAATIPQWWQLVYSFTPKELVLIDKLLSGLTLPEAAEQLHVSHNTVRTHLHHILSKMHCTSQNQLLVKLLSNH
ncbi:transcriptional regulator, LuxR family [Shewanella halifaxensis HAW-EB4]|uniref:Transcriptional regulator, LuxR family n=1 Tax=Shewanella halifaxensis (strain HAW-EB4) TaxID=458817 RepID=B0TSF3_SHEHH|nr:LuxR C-terminal-related transcriptional regulator [Shewanella halifaxensis]ABZ76533.1 transcriptional regulator, LuxR family [Shewanella halifaxensis HAW-EB4]